MKYEDNNRHRNERNRNVPEPVFQRLAETEQREFEDRALDSSLKVLAASRHDGESFLQQVNARVESTQASAVSTASECDQTFFGLTPSLMAKVDSSSDRETITVKASSIGTRRHSIMLALISAAAVIFISLIGWQTFLATPVDNPTLVADSSIEDRNLQGDRPAPVSDTIETSVAHHELPTSTPLKEAESAVIECVDGSPSGDAEIALSPEPKLEPELELELETGSTTEFVADPEIEPFWHFRLEFDESNQGTAWIGKRKIQDRIPIQGSDAAFKGICHEVAKHVHYYSPILSVQWQGQLSISGPDFLLEERFNGIDQMFDAGIRVRGMFQEKLGQMDIQTPVSKVASRVNPNFETLKLNSTHNHVIQQSLAVTDKMLQAKLDPSVYRKSESVLYKSYAQLRQGDLVLADVDTKGPDLAKREAGVVFTDFGEFKTKSTFQLKSELDQTPQFDLFDDLAEFKIWRDHVVRSSDLQRLKHQKIALQNQAEGARSRSRKRRIQKLLENNETGIAQLRQQFGEEISIEGQGSDPHIAPLVSLLPHKPALAGFQLAMGDECHLGESDAEAMDGISKGFGPVLANFDSFGSRNPDRVDPGRMKSLSNMVQAVAFHDNADQAMGTIDQMLQIENTEIRMELIKALGRLDSDVACRLLACYAKYDVEAEVRVAATDALRTFPPEMSRPELIEGFSYPWPDAARHAAEALVRLNDTEAVPKLVELLDKPDPRMPKRQDDGIFVQREMVAINHLRNCLLCHQDSHDEFDKGRGVVPTWQEPLPPEYYANRNPSFARVRADITYLRQDFSLVRKVKKHGRWPENQRFDFVARTKSLSVVDAEKITKEMEYQPNHYRDSIDMALRRLTQKSPHGSSSDAWKAALRSPGT